MYRFKTIGNTIATAPPTDRGQITTKSVQTNPGIHPNRIILCPVQLYVDLRILDDYQQETEKQATLNRLYARTRAL